MDWTGFFKEIVFGNLNILLKIALIIFPLFTIVEIIDEKGYLTTVSNIFKPFLKHFRLPNEASLPIIVAQTFGIVYGAGLILRATNEGKMNKTQITTIVIFFSICHSIFEDILLFVAEGANGLIIFVFRLFLAILITFIYSNYLSKDSQRHLNTKSISS